MRSRVHREVLAAIGMAMVVGSRDDSTESDAPRPHFGLLSPEVVIDLRTVIVQLLKSMSAHLSPMASPRRTPVARSSARNGANLGSKRSATLSSRSASPHVHASASGVSDTVADSTLRINCRIPAAGCVARRPSRTRRLNTRRSAERAFLIVPGALPARCIESTRLRRPASVISRRSLAPKYGMR
jgi:hypothetical protein